jgi:DNA-binding SARP family transcriptional activator
VKAEELAQELKSLYDSLGPFDRGNIEGLMADLDYTNQWLSRSAELLAEAQYHHDKARGDASENHMDATATLLRELLGRDCASEARMLKLAERLNATLCHRIDSLRSLISLEKENLKMSQGGTRP